MSKPWILGLGMAIAAVLTSPAFAQEEERDTECIAQCRDAHQDCRFDAREAGAACLEEAGCDSLRDEYREACFTEERDDETCADARTAFRECVEPCRDVRHEVIEACREDTAVCLEEECGIDEPIRRRRGRRGGGRDRR